MAAAHLGLTNGTPSLSQAIHKQKGKVSKASRRKIQAGQLSPLFSMGSLPSTEKKYGFAQIC
jgi:hypothetical protein